MNHKINKDVKDNFEYWYDYLISKFPEMSVTDAVKAATELVQSSCIHEIYHYGLDVTTSEA
jgi:hypothetical protein